jgi:hypothetical protein
MGRNGRDAGHGGQPAVIHVTNGREAIGFKTSEKEQEYILRQEWERKKKAEQQKSVHRLRGVYLDKGELLPAEVPFFIIATRLANLWLVRGSPRMVRGILLGGILDTGEGHLRECSSHVSKDC